MHSSNRTSLHIDFSQPVLDDIKVIHKWTQHTCTLLRISVRDQVSGIQVWDGWTGKYRGHVPCEGQ